MKIIGIGQRENYESTFIIDISNKELEKLLGSYYANNIGETKLKVADLRPGHEIDVNNLHDMTTNIVAVCDKMQKTMDKFKDAQTTLIKFSSLILEQGASK